MAKAHFNQHTSSCEDSFACISWRKVLWQVHHKDSCPHSRGLVQVHHRIKTRLIPHSTTNTTNPRVLPLPMTFIQVLDMSE